MVISDRGPVRGVVASAKENKKTFHLHAFGHIACVAGRRQNTPF